MFIFETAVSNVQRTVEFCTCWAWRPKKTRPPTSSKHNSFINASHWGCGLLCEAAVAELCERRRVGTPRLSCARSVTAQPAFTLTLFKCQAHMCTFGPCLCLLSVCARWFEFARTDLCSSGRERDASCSMSSSRLSSPHS